MPVGWVEALVFLLYWCGDGLKDFYRTRHMSDVEWHQLVEHNAAKGAPLAELTIPEARALLDAAQAESRRFSRPMTRDYFFFSSRRRHTRLTCDWSSDVCSSD